MPRLSGRTPWTCQACLQATRRHRARQLISQYSTKSGAEPAPNVNNEAIDIKEAQNNSIPQVAESKEPGAMTRRLKEATEETLLTGGKAGQRAIEDAGFSEELKEKLFDKISTAKFRKQYAGAFAITEINPSAGEGTRTIATSEPWTGQETRDDAVLRMLDDARKPLRPELRGKFQPPEPVDMRIKREPVLSPGQRVAQAREKAASYTEWGAKTTTGLSDKEKEEMKAGFRERFTPRAMPNSISGLEALANERIENAISRGQFKDIPRGPGIERDTRANNPFIDTTEYIMNKMIQRQDMRPPWIEKQQEVRNAINTFRARLRNDWKRHAARMIAAEGGSLEEQMKRADDYALSEKLHNPRSRTAEKLPPSSESTQDSVADKAAQQVQQAKHAAAEALASTLEAASPIPRPYRDPAWEKAEMAYMTLSIDNVNGMTRSYNLMAPELAKKPYFSLQRELAACYSDVAPLLANEIKERAARPASGTFGRGYTPVHKASVLEHLRFSQSNVVDEVPTKVYGFKELWRDMFKKA